ncbi:MAG: 2-hydroxyacid dehydrogenase [Chthoniobacteraceae bacterium]
MKKKIVVYSTKPYDRTFLSQANESRGHELIYLEDSLKPETASLAVGADVVCVFVHDHADAGALKILAEGKTKLLTLRCAGYNNVDLTTAAELGLDVRRVPSYSPYAVAEFALALIFTLNRKVHRAYNRVREGNFALDGLLGFDLHGCTVGIIGTGKIGCLTAPPLKAMGCRILGYDVNQNPAFLEAGGTYKTLDEVLAESDIISLHCPLTPETHHLVNEESLAKMKPGVMIINTSRGALIDATAVIAALKSGKVGYLGLDVYEQEEGVFYQNLSNEIIQDDVLQRLLTFPNVLVTSHQAFFTETALKNIAETTMQNIEDHFAGRPSSSQLASGK